MMPDPFSATEGELAPHWNTLTAELVPQLDIRASKVSLKAAPVGDKLIASFIGEAARRAGRLRGDPMPVVPFRSISSNWEVWLGYREVWTLKGGNPKRFNFASSDLTIFFAIAGSEAFQQILRAEWMGPEKSLEGWSFKPSNAAHPHWQIDIAETLKLDADLEAARELLREVEPREFGAPEPAPVPDPPWYQIGRMHLASAMRPWADGLIAHGPADLAAVRMWVVNTVNLLQIELERI
ncbi:hypothetical protein [Microvirga sp. M2]|uniref:hypothetical protein n=1 Tax=Microvirga sp. M2 TaxID=3073270 RepID=UPI0039C2E4FD